MFSGDGVGEVLEWSCSPKVPGAPAPAHIRTVTGSNAHA
jgi:hypothetical protein